MFLGGFGISGFLFRMGVNLTLDQVTGTDTRGLQVRTGIIISKHQFSSD